MIIKNSPRAIGKLPKLFGTILIVTHLTVLAPKCTQTLPLCLELAYKRYITTLAFGTGPNYLELCQIIVLTYCTKAHLHSPKKLLACST